MPHKERDQRPDRPTQQDAANTHKHPGEAADEGHNPDHWEETDGNEQPTDQQDIHKERADWEGKWRDTPYDSFADARHNVSHIGDPKTDYDSVFESDDHVPTSGESVRRRGTDEWSVPDPLY